MSLAELPPGQVNLSDPDSKLQEITKGYVQGYNAQAVVDEGQIVLAAEITNSTVDWSQLNPMVSATQTERDKAAISARPEVALADAQLGRGANGRGGRQPARPGAEPARLWQPKDPRPGWSGGRYTWTRYVLASAPDRELYRNANTWSNRSSVTPNTTRKITDFSDEAGPRCAPNGDCPWQEVRA